MKRVSDSPARLPLLDMSRGVSDEDYDQSWPKHKAAFDQTLTEHLNKGDALIILIEGWDAGGKTSTITQITDGLPPDQVIIRHIIAPTDEEASHPFLWRFEKILPKPGQLLVLDRSWYGRLLVERVEGLTPAVDWQKAFDEINQFEGGLAAQSIKLIKIWLQVSEQEQAERVAARILKPEKRHKLSERDVINFMKRSDYEIAAEDIFALTDDSHAPWHLVAGDCKKAARLHIIKQLIKWLE